MNKTEEIVKLKEKLQEKFDNEKHFNKNESFDNFFNKIKKISFDNKYALWIVYRYIDNGIQRYEDLDRTEKALSYFHRYKNRLDKKDRNIMNIKSLVDLENLVEPFAELNKQKELEKLQKEKIYFETKIIYDGPEGKILVPLSKEASVFWGQGTKWCTASTDNNIFDLYNNQGPLYIFILPEKDEKGREFKYQLHLPSKQFMDYEDRRITKENHVKSLLLKWFANIDEKEKLLHTKNVFKENMRKYNDYNDVDTYHPEIKKTIMIYAEREYIDFVDKIKNDLEHINYLSNESFKYRKNYNVWNRFFPILMNDNDFKKQQMLHLENILKKYNYSDLLWMIRINQKAFHDKFSDIFEKAVSDGLPLDYVPEKFINSKIIKKSLHHVQEYNTDFYEKYMNKEIAKYILINLDIIKLFDMCHMKSSVWNKDYYILKYNNSNIIVDIISNNLERIPANNIIFFQFLFASRFEEDKNNAIYQKFTEALNKKKLEDKDYTTFLNTHNLFDMYKVFPFFEKSLNFSKVNYENFAKNFDMIFNKTGLYTNELSYYIFDINNRLIEFDTKYKDIFTLRIKNLIITNPDVFFTVVENTKNNLEKTLKEIDRNKQPNEKQKQYKAIVFKQKEIFFSFIKNINIVFSTEIWTDIIEKSTKNNILKYFSYEDHIKTFPAIGNGLREFALKSKFKIIKNYYKHVIDEKTKTYPVAIPMVLHDVDSLIKLAQEYKNK